MKTSLVLLTFLFTFSCSVLGQNRTYLGFELSATNDLPGFTGVFERNEGGASFVNGVWGFNLSQELGNRFVLETGFLQKNIPPANPPTLSLLTSPPNQDFSRLWRSGGFEVWQIPLRLRTNIVTIDQKVTLFARTGYRLNLHTGGDAMFGGDDLALLAPDGTSIEYVVEYEDVRRNFSVLELGIGAEFFVFQKVSFVFHGSYFGGFQDIQRQTAIFQYEDGSLRTGGIVMDGSYLNVGVTVAYPISDIWQKKKK